jgi:SAM-dependent methyltransferase
MHQMLADRLRCPQCHGRLGLQAEAQTAAGVETGWLDCLTCVQRFPVVNGIPRFVPVSNYADSFARLWDRFHSTVLDSSLGVQQSHHRFFRETGWKPEDLRGQWLLEIGCGAGRFTEIALECGAQVVAIDYSGAVDSCRRNLGEHSRLHLLQADVYALPFRPQGFDFVCSFGTLHRTPNAKAALLALPSQLRTGGRLAVDIAAPRWFRRYGPTAWLRTVTKRMHPDRAVQFATRLASSLLPFQQALGCVPYMGSRLERWFPISPVDTLHQCTQEAARQRACLAMCDRLTAVHHQTSRVSTMHRWLLDAGLQNTEAFFDGMVVGRGTKPSPNEASAAA